MSGKGEGSDFISQARTLAAGTREPYIAWSYLKRWATGKGPLAMKAAMMGFLEQHGSKPESAAILPEIIRNASMLPPSERNSITEFTNQSFSSIAGFKQPFSKQLPFAQRMNISKPQFSSAFKLRESPVPHSAAGRFDTDHMTSMRDDVFRMNEAVIQAGKLPAPKSVEVQQSHHNISRESFGPMLGAQKSHALVSSLIDRVRLHGRSEFHTLTKKVKPVKIRPKPKVKARIRTRAKPKAKARVRPKARTKKSRIVARTRKTMVRTRKTMKARRPAIRSRARKMKKRSR